MMIHGRHRFGTMILALAVLVLPSEVFGDDHSPTLSKIARTGAIKIGHRTSSIPFSYIGSDDAPIGYSIDLCLRIVEAIKQELGRTTLDVDFVAVTSTNRIPKLVNGEIDMECGSTTNNLTRARQVDFLSIMFITGTKLAVPAGSGIRKLEDLEGRSIALTAGTTNEEAVRKAINEKHMNIRIVSVRDHDEGWEKMTTGAVDAFATDHVLLYGLISKFDATGKFKVVGPFLSYDPYGIMVPKGDSVFRLIGNRVLAEMMRNGEIYDVYDHWFNPGVTGMRMPINDTLRAAFLLQALPR